MEAARGGRLQGAGCSIIRDCWVQASRREKGHLGGLGVSSPHRNPTQLHALLGSSISTLELGLLQVKSRDREKESEPNRNRMGRADKKQLYRN